MENMKLTDVHQALSTAATESLAESQPLYPFSFRISKETAEKVQELCARHGTTLSEFVRQCCEGLVKDYQS